MEKEMKRFEWPAGVFMYVGEGANRGKPNPDCLMIPLDMFTDNSRKKFMVEIQNLIGKWFVSENYRK